MTYIEKTYVTHTCKNKKCKKAFMAVDKNHNIDFASCNSYCNECKKIFNS